jgi:hypothetical protein
LGQVHGAKFASTDQRNAYGIIVSLTLLQLKVQTHAASLVWSKGTSVVTKALAGKPLAQGKSTG